MARRLSASSRSVTPTSASSLVRAFSVHYIQRSRMGCINLHKGKVPEYRGMPPGFWEIYKRRKDSGSDGALRR